MARRFHPSSFGTGSREEITEEKMHYLGPSEYYSPDGENPQLIIGGESDNIRLEDLRIENCKYGFVLSSGSLSVGNCSFSHCQKGINSISPGGVLVENSEFFQQGGWSFVTSSGCRDVTIVDCSFHGYGTGIGFNWTPNANVISCQFDGLYTAVGYFGSSTGQVTSCTVSNVRTSVEIATSSRVHLLDNFFEATWVSLFLSGNSYVSGTGNVFCGGGTEYGTLNFSGGSTADLSNNHILRGDGFAVSLIYYYYDHRVLNLANNYWGTTDIETIEEWIHDGNDDPSIHGTVSFLPLADGPVATESTSLGSLKAMFR